MRRLRQGSYRTVPGEHYGTPKEVWGFRSDRIRGSRFEAAQAFLRAHASLLGLEPSLRGVRPQRIIASVGAHHVIFQQKVLGLWVHRGYVTVHIGRDSRVFLVKNRAVPKGFLPTEAAFELGATEARRRAQRALPQRDRPAIVLPPRASHPRSRHKRGERMWYPWKDRLLPTWRIRLARTAPREEWIVYVNAKTGGILEKYDNLAAVRGRGLVFDPSPVTALGGHERLLPDESRDPVRPPQEAYRAVTLRSLRSGGRLDGKRVTTEPTTRRRRVQRRDRRFLLRSDEDGFEEVMAYYHIDSAIRYLENLGYRGERAIFTKPFPVNASGTTQDQSWYSPTRRQITFGLGDIDDAEDGETILHEFGHAIQDAICPDFGQSPEAAAMGEGFGDYFAASFFADRKPARYRPCVMTWDGLLLGIENDLDPPCLRRVDADWTYDDFDDDGDEHDNGEIWSATLWDIRKRLGRDIADPIVLESHFQLDGFTTFDRGARAIIDADQNLNRGRHRTALRTIFRKRRIAPV